jgi:PAS domain S-box-containing protein
MRRPIEQSPEARLYQALVESIRDYAILMLDSDGYVMSWNQGAQLITGYAPADIIGSHFSRFYPAEALARDLPAHELRTAKANGRFEDEGWRLRKDGSRFWANVVISRMVDERGELIGFSKITRDLSTRREQELALRHSEERFRLLVSGVKDYAIFMLDPDGKVQTWNAGAQHIKGYHEQEIVGRHFSQFYPQEAKDRGLPEMELRGATLQGRFEDEGWRVRKDGSRFWANVIITAVRNSAGQLMGFSKITRDLTERRAHEDQLRLGEERFRLLVDGVSEYAIMMLDPEGFVTSWNAGAERINGYKSEQVLGKHLSHFYTSESITEDKPWQDLTAARNQGRMTEEGWRLRKDGTLFWATTVITALRDQDGRPYGFAHVVQDLTQRRHSEALADTAQRMHEFIAMLAHELRNPLAPIRNAVALMGRKGLGDPILESMRQTIDRQSLLLTRLLDELLDVNRIARGQFSIEHELIDLREVVARAVETSQPLIDAREHRLDVKLPDQPILVRGDAIRLTQAILNLLNNAAKYTPRGGLIRLSAAARSAQVEVRVRDNGRGIDPAMLEKIFDLFVQLDPNASATVGGLGVGLALVRRVIELHGGSIQACSGGAGRGAEFIARLPRSLEQMQIVAPHEPSGDALQRFRVLIVDDNKDAADTLSELLTSMHQDIVVAYDGASAIAAAKTFLPEIVLLDIGMPEMSGYEVARFLLSEDSSEKPVMVAVTGWGQGADEQQALDAGFDYHFVKPMSVELLRKLLADIATQRLADWRKEDSSIRGI